MTVEELVLSLARKARDLTRGMQERVKRDPDVADYASAFELIVREYERKREKEQW